MYTIEFTKECGCFIRSGMKNNMSFNSKEEAKKEADKMMDEINETFCHKHDFKLEEVDEGFKIIVSNAKKSGQ